jgi:hypothetical protein
MPRHISLSDVVFNRVFCLVSFRISFRGWIPICGCVCRGFLSRVAAQPGPARPWPHALGALLLPMCAPPLVSLSLIQFSRAATSSPPPLSLPRCALGFGDGDRRIWTSR